MEDTILRAAALVIAIGGALGVLTKGIRDLWKMARRVAQILELVESELKPNGGMSLKDQVTQNSRALQKLSERREADHNHAELYEAAQAHRDVLLDEVLRSILDRLRAIDGGVGGEHFDPPEGTPV